jgi:melanoma-associated antigen p97
MLLYNSIRPSIAILTLTALIAVQNVNRCWCAMAPNPNLQMLGRWCCLNAAEYMKCIDWRNGLHSANRTNVLLECVLATDKFDCFKKIFEDRADLMTADAGEVYTAGKFYNLQPISTEIYTAGPTQPMHSEYYAVAVVKRGSGMSINRLRGSNSCHGGVGTSSGWNMPISTLIEKQLLEIVDCNNHVKAATRFFNKMCAPDALNVQFNPTGDNPTSACELCRGRIGSTFCTNQDPYAGPIGAMYCLIDGGGDVAFVKHTTINELAAINRSINVNDFELLCPNVYGSPFNSPGNVTIYPYPTAPITDFMSCNWGVVPGRAILTSGRKAIIQRESYRRFLRISAELFGGQAPLSLFSSTPPSSFFNNYNASYNSFVTSAFNPYATQNVSHYSGMAPMGRFYLFDSRMYNARDLLFLDQTAGFNDVADSTTYLSFLRKYIVNFTSS